MGKWRFVSLRVLGLLAMGVGIVGCGGSSSTGSPSSKSSSKTPVHLVLNWLPTPESGGEYAAVKKHYYQQQGLDITVEPGGHHVSPLNLVTAGAAQFGIAQGMDQLLLAREHGLPVVALMLTYQTSPAAFMYRPSLNIKSFAGFNGHTVYYNFANVYWKYLVKRYRLNHVTTRSYTGNLGPFLSNPNAINQAFITNEPFYVRQHGVKIKTLMLSSSGYNPGADILFTTSSYLKSHPSTVRKVVQATEKGWNYYYGHEASINKYLLGINKLLNIPGMRYEATTQKSLMITNMVKKHGFGYMSPSQWSTMEHLMLRYGLLQHSVPVKNAYTNKFISPSP